jgi:hypothetical protein
VDQATFVQVTRPVRRKVRKTLRLAAAGPRVLLADSRGAASSRRGSPFKLLRLPGWQPEALGNANAAVSRLAAHRDWPSLPGRASHGHGVLRALADSASRGAPPASRSVAAQARQAAYGVAFGRIQPAAASAPSGRKCRFDSKSDQMRLGQCDRDCRSHIGGQVETGPRAGKKRPGPGQLETRRRVTVRLGPGPLTPAIRVQSACAQSLVHMLS